MIKFSRPNLTLSFTRTSLTMIALLFAFTMQGCGKIQLVLRSLLPTRPSISGSVAPLAGVSNLSSPTSLACTNTRVSLFELSATGEKVEPPIDTVAVSADGKFRFANIDSKSEISLSGTQVNGSYLLETSGCTDKFSRKLTGLANQDITFGSTLVNYALTTANAAALANSDNAQMEQLIASIASETSYANAYAKLSTDTNVTQAFNDLVGASPSILLDAAPLMLSVEMPTSVRELESHTLAVITTHWLTSYDRAFKWEIDGQSVGTTASSVYTPSANSQGTHTLTISFGKEDSFGNLDTSKPLVTKSYPLTIENNHPAVAPALSIVGSAHVASPNLSLSIATGAALANCNTFSSLALTEDTTVAPSVPSDFNITCATSPTQPLAYTLQNGVGTRTLRLWARDSSGNVSSVPQTLTVTYSTAVPTINITAPATTGPFRTAFSLDGTCDTTAGDVTVSGPVSGTPLTISCSSGTFHTDVTLTGADGSKTITVSQTNVFGSTGTDSVIVTKDVTEPTVVIASTAPASTATSPIPITITFSESVTGFVTADLVVANGTVTSFSGSGTTYSAQVTPTAQGPVTVDVAAGRSQDAAGNPNQAATTLSRIFDSVSPTVLISSSAANPTNASAISVSIVFSESVTGFALTDLTLTNAVASALTGSGASYSFQLTPSSQGSFSATLPAGAAQDASANTSAASTTLTRVYDSVQPAVTLSTIVAEPTNVSPIPVTVTFTESVTGFSLSDLALTNATAANLSGSGLSYSFDLTPSSSSIVSVQVNAGTSQDSAANTNQASNTLSRTFSNVQPTISITSSAASPTNLSAIPVTFTFSAAVTGFTSSDVTLTNATLFNFVGTGTTYTADLVPFTQGSVTAQVAAAVAKDSALNDNLASSTFSTIYDSVVPTLSLTNPVDNSYVSLSNLMNVVYDGTCSENGRDVTLTLGALSTTVACSSNTFSASFDATSLADGNLTTTANHTDLATNAATQISRTLIKNTSNPVATLSGLPTSPSNTTTLAVTVAGANVTHYKYKVGASSAVDCSVASGYSSEAAVATPITSDISAVADGVIRICVIGRNVAGYYQPEASATTATWTKDTVVSAFSGLAITPTSPGNDTTPTIAGSTEALNSVSFYSLASCGGSVLGTASAAADGTFAVTPGSSVGSDGTYAFSVRSVDAAGNSLCSSTVAYVLDTSVPTVVLSSSSATSTSVSPIPVTVMFNSAVTGFALADLSVSNATAGSLTGSGASYSFSLTPSGQGAIAVSVNAGAAVDSANNLSLVSNTLNFTYDTVAPVLTMAAPVASAHFNVPSVTASGACEAGLSITVGGSGVSTPASATCTSSAYSFTLTFTAGEGIKNISVTQTDAAGNATTVNRAVTVDTTAPALAFSNAPTQTQATSASTALFGGSCETGINIIVAGGTDTGSVPCTSGTWNYTTASQSSDATRTYTFTQTDAASNTLTITGTWRRDTTAPPVTIASPANGTIAQSGLTLSGACETGLSISIGGTGILSPLTISCSAGTYSQAIFFSAGDGAKSITVSQTDAVGNVGSVTGSFTRDTASPAITQTTQSSPYYTKVNTATFGGACETGLTVSVTREGVAESTTTCSAGTWSYTTASQTTDGSRLYAFSQTDAAGNTGSTSTSWVRDNVAPNLTFTSTSSFATSSSSVTFAGTCETGFNVIVSGAASTSVACSAGSWSYAATSGVDGTFNYSFTQSDQATNSTTINGSWVRNTTGPVITITSTNPLIISNGSTTIAGTCTNGLTITVSGSLSTTTSCSSGLFSLPVSLSNGAYAINFSQTDAFSNTSTATANIIQDNTPPAPNASSFVIGTGSGTVGTSYPTLSFTASDSLTRIMSFCVKVDDATNPGTSDSCWTSVSASPPGVTPAKNITVTNYPFLLSFDPGGHDVYLWVKDEVGNMSAMTNTNGLDKRGVTYTPALPPSLDLAIATSSNTPSNPPSSGDMTVGAGSYIYIKWKASGSLGGTPISLSFSTDESTWSSITSGLANSAGTGCVADDGGSTLDDGMTGCYRWSSPTGGNIRLRVGVTDTNGNVAFKTSGLMNTGAVKMIAGNVDDGLGGSASKAMLFNRIMPTDKNQTDTESFVVTNEGNFIFRDIHRGILIVKPSDGILNTFIRTTGTSSGDGGNVSSATLNHPYKIVLDYNNGLLIWDYDRIRRVDLSTNTITTLIGGGSDTADSVVDALNVKIDPASGISNQWEGEQWRARAAPLVPLPNGDIYFQSENYGWDYTGQRFRIYRPGDATQVTAFRPNGVGNSYGNPNDITNATLQGLRLSFDLNSSAVSNFFVHTANVYGRTAFKTPATNRDEHSSAVLNASYQPVSTSPSAHPYINGPIDEFGIKYFTGMDGKAYAVYWGHGGLIRYNQQTQQWQRVLGNGQGTCADGTAALSCQIQIFAAFVTASGKIYFMDAGRLRTVTSAGTVATIYGQSFSYGNGGSPLQARFGAISEIQAANDGSIMIVDNQEAVVRELNSTRTLISHVTGRTGVNGHAVPGASATNEPIHNDWDRVGMVYDKANRDIYSAIYEGSNRKLVRLNRITNQYEVVVGNGSTADYRSADGLLGSQISGFQVLRPIGYGNGKVLTQSLWNWYDPGTEVGRVYEDSAMNLYDANASFTQSTLLKKSGALSYYNSGAYSGLKLCDDGIALSNCQSGVIWWGNGSKAFYDTAGARWLLSNHNYYDVRIADPAVGTMQTLATLPKKPLGIAYRRTGGQDFVYYCGDDFNLYKYNATTAIETQMTLPGVMKCSASGIGSYSDPIEYDAANDKILFISYQRGLFGVAQIDP